MEHELIPLTDPERMVERGLPYETTHQARWAYRHAGEQGLAAAFVKLGRRVYVNPVKFHELALERAARTA